MPVSDKRPDKWPATPYPSGAQLVVHTGSLAGCRFDLPAARSIILGRARECGVRFHPQKDRLVSGRHATVASRREGCYLADLGSSNGTFVHGTRVEEERRLKDGDQFRLGADGPIVEFRELSSDMPERTIAQVAPRVNRLVPGGSRAGACPTPPAPQAPRVNRLVAGAIPLPPPPARASLSPPSGGSTAAAPPARASLSPPSGGSTAAAPPASPIAEKRDEKNTRDGEQAPPRKRILEPMVLKQSVMIGSVLAVGCLLGVFVGFLAGS